MPGYNEDAVSAVARHLDLDEWQEEQLQRAVEEYKLSTGRRGDDNLTYQEILEIAQELFG